MAAPFIIEQDAIPEVRDNPQNTHARDKFIITDMSGLLDMIHNPGPSCGRGDFDFTGRDTETYLRVLERGRPDLTAAVDQHMTRFTDMIFTGKAFETRDDVCGGVPNVPAYLAGVPLAMRRRHRVMSGKAPLCICFELTGSSGSMASRPERGAAMLALVHLLANTRPVEFWTLTTYGRVGRMNMIAVKMESQPLEVARAAAQLADQNALTAITLANYHYLDGGSWSYGAPHLERTWSGEAFRRLVQPSSEMLFIPAAFMGDMLADPVKWVKDMLRQYGMGAVDHDED